MRKNETGTQKELEEEEYEEEDGEIVQRGSSGSRVL